MPLPVLIIASRHEILMGLSQALLKFGYQVMTSHPVAEEIDRGVRVRPALLVLRPPETKTDLAPCLALVRDRFADRSVPVLACVATGPEGEKVRAGLGGCGLLVGARLKLNDLYLRLQEVFDLVRRRELRITTEIVVAHHKPGGQGEVPFRYDPMTSLSMGGCFIRTGDPYPEGSGVEIVFCPGEAARTVRLRGTVRRHGRTAGGEGRPGMGIRFEPMAPEARGLLEAYLLGEIGTPGMPATL